MRLQLLGSHSARLAVCLLLAVAGCKSGRSGSSPWAEYASSNRKSLQSQDRLATKIAGRKPAAETKAETPLDSEVKPVRFDSFLGDDGDPAVAPAPLPNRTGRIGEDSLPWPELVRPGALDDDTPFIPEELEDSEDVCRIDLSTVLAMAGGQNPQVAFASQRYREAYAQLEAARALWLPSLRAGVSYNKHEGTLQAANGTILDVSRGSLNSGFGVQSVAAGSPAVTGLVADFHLSDAVFQPRIANRIAAARQEASRTTTNDVLLQTALAYLALLQAAQEKAIAEETLDNARQLADLTMTFADTGQGAQADADRAMAELVLRKNDVTRADEAIGVASARLNEWLHLPPTTTLVTKEPTIVPVKLVSRGTPVGELLATGLSNRPELAEAQHLVGEAVHRYRREKFAPLLPSAFLGASYGVFGGGRGDTLDNFDDRFDFDAVAYWEIRNLGFGEGAARDATRAQYEQARIARIRLLDQVAREIMEARAQVRARHKQIATAESGIEAATDSYQRNLERIRSGEGLPIEVLQSIQALDQARREYLRTVVEYNESQFQLHRALGWPIE